MISRMFLVAINEGLVLEATGGFGVARMTAPTWG
jgi:hypothetical protein